METAREYLKVWQPKHISNLELICGSFNNISTPRHFHEEFEISLLQHGEPWQLDYRGTKYTISPTSFTLTQPGEVHKVEFAGETEYVFRGLRIATHLVQDVATNMSESGLPFFPTPVITNNYLRGLILILYRRLDEGTASLLEQQSLILNILIYLVVCCAENRPNIKPPGRERQIVRRVRDYLVENYAENISLDQLAQLALLSPFYLNRVFQKEFGLPPHAYQIHARIVRAKALLNQGHSIGQVALLTGFAHQSHFGWHFKRIVGIAPGQYLKGSNLWKMARTR